MLRDLETRAVVAQAAGVPVGDAGGVLAAALPPLNPAAGAAVHSVITQEMREGPRPRHSAHAHGAPASNRSKIILTHGFCSERVEFNPASFTDGIKFEDPHQAVSNVEFARRLWLFGEANAPGGCSIVSHSQGGTAAMALLKYYHSCLDRTADAIRAARGAREGSAAASPGGAGDLDWSPALPPDQRLIQTVATPFGGCPLAIFLAFFDPFCPFHHVHDLTPDGAASFVESVEPEIRAQVHFYAAGTSSFWRPCSFRANLVLSRPNDGIVEVERQALDGGSYMGFKEFQCHIEGMHHLAEQADEERNAEMNRTAARAPPPKGEELVAVALSPHAAPRTSPPRARAPACSESPTRLAIARVAAVALAAAAAALAFALLRRRRSRPAPEARPLLQA